MKIGAKKSFYTRRQMLKFGLMVALWMMLLPSATLFAANKQVNIAVLAIRGVPQAMDMWVPTANYLNNAIPGYEFTIKPVTIDSIEEAITKGKVEFVLTNPASYAQLEFDHGITRIATLRNKRPGGSYTQFGALIITRADRQDIQTLENLKGKSFMAVHPRAFGGWWMAWRKLKQIGINPENDFSRLTYSGFPQDKIVMAVKNGQVDAGTIRTDILERMASSNKIKLDDFRVLNPLSTSGFPFAHSTRLYPEWPFAITKNVSKELAQQVAIALLRLTPHSNAAKASKSEGWTVPLDYQPVHELMKELRVGIYANSIQITPEEVVSQYKPYITAISILFVVFIIAGAIILKFNRKLTLSKLILEKEVQERLRAESEEHKQVERMRTLYEVSSMPGLTLEQQIDEILKLGCRTLDMEVGKITLFNSEDNSTSMVNVVVPGSLDIDPGNTWNLDDSFSDIHAGENIDVLILNHVANSSYNHHPAYKATGVEAYIGMPILTDGKKHWTISFASPRPHEPFPDTDINIVKLMGRWVSVILEREKVESELQYAKEISESANKTKNNFLASMSHELRTPLNVIIGYSEILKEEAEADGNSRYQKDLEKIYGSGTNLLTLVNGILDISKIEADKMEVFIDPINLEQVLQEVASMVQTSIRENKNTLTINHPEDFGTFDTDYGKFRQILINLISNANKFTHGGNITIDGKIENIDGNEYVIISVKDTGIGIKPENIKNLFVDFTQVDQSHSRKFEGTGLGLAISQRFCKMMGGEITVESTPGAGSKFTVRLPNASNQDDEDGIVLMSGKG